MSLLLKVEKAGVK